MTFSSWKLLYRYQIHQEGEISCLWENTAFLDVAVIVVWHGVRSRKLFRRVDVISPFVVVLLGTDSMGKYWLEFWLDIPYSEKINIHKWVIKICHRIKMESHQALNLKLYQLNWAPDLRWWSGLLPLAFLHHPILSHLHHRVVFSWQPLKGTSCHRHLQEQDGYVTHLENRRLQILKEMV